MACPRLGCTLSAMVSRRRTIPGRLDMTSGSGAGIVAVFGSSQSQPGDGDYELGVEVGRLLAEAGYSVTNGGYGGG